MERRMLLAVVLSTAIFSLWMLATGQCTQMPKEPPAGNGSETPDGDAPVPAPREDGEPGEPPPPPSPRERGDETVLAAEVPISRERVVLENEELEVGFTNQGGAVEFVRLKNSYEVDQVTQFDLVVPVGDDLLLGQIDLTGLKPTDAPLGDPERQDDPAGALRTERWERDFSAEAATEAEDVVYVLETESAVWRKRWFLAQGKDRYDVTLRISREAREAEGAGNRRLKILASTGLLREGWTGAAFLYPNSVVYRYGEMSDPKESPYGLDVLGGTDRAGVRTLGTRSHYYLATWFGDPGAAGSPQVVRFWGTGEAADRRTEIQASVEAYFREVRGRDPDTEPRLRDRIRRAVQGDTEGFHHAWMVVDLPSGTDATSAEAAAIELPFYLGPIDRRTLAQPVYAAVRPVIAYRAALDVLAEALLGIYDLFRNLLGSAGLGVILMTLVVRGLMMPLSIRNQLSMRQYSRKIAKLKPELDKLKKKYGSNPQKMREQQAKLYREHGVGFPTGCLMMIVQIPVFFALFSSLRTEYTLRNASFGWIRDLGAPDKLVDFGRTLFDVGVLQVFSLNILPLLMVGLSLWQQRLMPKPADEQQAQQMRMMKWLPIVFAVILYNYTAALALYMVLSSAVSIVEGKIVRAKDPTPDAPGAAPTPMM